MQEKEYMQLDLHNIERLYLIKFIGSFIAKTSATFILLYNID